MHNDEYKRELAWLLEASDEKVAEFFESCVNRNNFYDETLARLAETWTGSDSQTIEYLHDMVDHFDQCRAIAQEWELDAGLEYCDIHVQALHDLIDMRIAMN